MLEHPSPAQLFGDLGLQASDVQLIYETLLGRSAVTEEVNAQLRATLDWRELLLAVAGSAEFAARQRQNLGPVEARVNVWHPDLAFAAHVPGTSSADGEVVVGEEGWLYLVGGTNAVLDQYQPGFELADGWFDGWSEVVQIRSADAARLGAALAMVVVPDKLSVLRHQLPPGVTLGAPSPASRLVALGVLFPAEELRSLDGGAYLRTDTHLSLGGNAELARVVLESLGVRSPVLDGVAVRYPVVGDLGRRFATPVLDIVEVTGHLGAARVVEDNSESVRRAGRHVGTRTVFARDEAPDSRVAVLFGDSFSVASPGYQGLAWFLAQVFAEVHMVWSPFGWDPAYLERVGAGVAVCETAERFTPQVPATTVDVDALARAAEAPRG